MTTIEKFTKFCESVKNGFGTILDSSVKTEYIRIFENISPIELSSLLSILEKYSLLDKKNCVNKQQGFYLKMFESMINKKDIKK